MVIKNQNLAQILKRNNNNLDLLRLLAACLVIYGHSFSLLPSSGGSDLVLKVTGFNAADIAVKTFFFLSGLLIANSLLESRNLLHYGITRITRIWPGLIFVLLVTTLVIGPIATSLPLDVYFSSEITYKHFIYYSIFKGWGGEAVGANSLPGVFLLNPYPLIVNAPLWTLMVEGFVYVFIAACWVLGLLNRRVAPFLFILIIVDSILPKTILFHWLPVDSHDFSLMPYSFALGALMAIFKDSIEVDWKLPFAIFLMGALMRGSVVDLHLAYAGIFALSVFVFSSAAIIKIKLKYDLSYGVYLWGWPLQQILVNFFPNLNIINFQLLSIIFALFMAWVSWKVVEQRGMEIGRRLSSKWASNN
jgi:peptidoglycan/LPS O-acetylase OafA/YrhL